MRGIDTLETKIERLHNLARKQRDLKRNVCIFGEIANIPDLLTDFLDKHGNGKATGGKVQFYEHFEFTMKKHTKRQKHKSRKGNRVRNPYNAKHTVKDLRSYPGKLTEISQKAKQQGVDADYYDSRYDDKNTIYQQVDRHGMCGIKKGKRYADREKNSPGRRPRYVPANINRNQSRQEQQRPIVNRPKLKGYQHRLVRSERKNAQESEMPLNPLALPFEPSAPVDNPQGRKVTFGKNDVYEYSYFEPRR